MGTTVGSSGAGPTHVVELTPPGRGAVSVVLVVGPEAVRMVDACFQWASGRRLGDAAVGRIATGRWGGPQGEELIACRRCDDTVEIHCHGGGAAVREVADRLCELGGVRVAWRDWLLAREPNPIRAAARFALAEATTARTAAILVDQMQGALEKAVHGILASAGAGDWPAATRQIDALLTYRGVGLHLATPWQVVLAGRPNVGKSSLLNALAGYQRAIVFDRPGTTRDVVTVGTAIDGWPVELADTAGLRATEDALESAGVARAAAALANADLVVMIEDATEIQAAGGVCAAALPEDRLLRVLNKIDLLPRGELPPVAGLRTSARTGEGVGELAAAIGAALVPSAPPTFAAVPFTAEQVSRLDAARTAAGRRDAPAVDASLRPLLAT